MPDKEFVAANINTAVENGSVSWEAPSNIALVKYWGKKENQIPANPSLSFTLKNCKTTTKLNYVKVSEDHQNSEEINFEVVFEGVKKESFKPKIASFFKRILPYCAYLKQFSFEVVSENSFPHSSGIASSASGMSALALCVMSLEKSLFPEMSEDFFYKKASFLARLGSGSAGRSVKGSMVVWGEHKDILLSSDYYGIEYPLKTDAVFKDYQDTVLLVDKGIKQVSSTVGHDLMHGHPFAEARFKQANDHLSELIPAFEKGDIQSFIKIVESEALSLHSMMMSSDPYFLLMKPNTLALIHKIWEKREESGIPVCFTLDAGANVHMLYPAEYKKEILEFVKNELVVYCENGHYICDEVGEGSKML
ncbi:diphosphomevalonate/mevalonate 3,5-bisphosphate decarboxylase family protein [Zunongwangia endophytica]|uniref:Diphosphomevalonate/mevalonate 3,5-bisphosphate decarboxylase family protein n=1 Tax=Zunongwangia endophytica TaxID=1808945 RepID=A0ABV8H580_9FLAO|nr:diphosphomevalonate decarboxylase [Zunongwangia endophytica]MDN3595460.1 diphosphomevalonate decarboxylase [Zunongwangia endophytica]